MRKTKDAAPPAPQEVLPPVAGKAGKAGKAGEERDPEFEGLMSEIESDLREEELRKLWTRYGKAVVAVFVLAVIAVIGVQLWRQHVSEQRQAIAERYYQAEAQLAAGKLDDALATFADVAKTRGEGYAVLADLDRAAVLIKKQDGDGAIAIYKAIAADTKADPIFRNLATILQVLHTMDMADPKTLEPLLAPLMTPNNAFHNIATELSAVLAAKGGDRARAAKLAEQLIADPAVSPAMRTQAQDLAAFYKSNSALPAVMMQQPEKAAPAPSAPPKP